VRSRVARFIALCVALLVIGESAGIARAFDAGSRVDCCCGSHAIARACKCLHCPTRLRHAHTHEAARLTAPDSCQPTLYDGLLAVTAVTIDPPTPAASTSYVRLVRVDEAAPPGVALDPVRPPP
jgi:hypothetical protein